MGLEGLLNDGLIGLLLKEGLVGLASYFLEFSILPVSGLNAKILVEDMPR